MKLTPETVNYVANMAALANLHTAIGPELFAKFVEIAKKGSIEELASFMNSSDVQDTVTSKISAAFGELLLEHPDVFDMYDIDDINVPATRN